MTLTGRASLNLIKIVSHGFRRDQKALENDSDWQSEFELD
jgi:hypothetical protein